jgi:hypothetical protein
MAGDFTGGHKLLNTDLTKGTSEWEGWGTALKPAREDWLLMRKPIESKTVAENCLKWGTGGINIDESRVETTEELNYGTGKKSNVGFKTSPQNNDRPIYDGQGRFPANLILSDSEEVRECFPETKTGGVLINAGREYDNKGTSMFNGGGFQIHKQVMVTTQATHLVSSNQ